MSETPIDDRRVEIDGPSISMSAVKLVLRIGGEKRILDSAERTAEDIVKKQRGGAARRPGRIDRRFRVSSTTVAGFDTVSIEPPGLDRDAPSIVYLPGGAYTYPLLKAHWWIVSALARDNRTRVHLVPYPLAPEGSARSVIPKVADLVEELAGGEGRAPMLSGDSAGGGLALATAQLLRDQGRQLPTHLVLLSPWLDVSMSDPDISRVADPSLGVPGLEYCGGLWADGMPLTDSAVSPIYGEMQGLCPITATVGTADLTQPDCEKLAIACEAAGVDMSLLVATGGFHVFIAATLLREARTARRFISSRISAGAR